MYNETTVFLLYYTEFYITLNFIDNIFITIVFLHDYTEFYTQYTYYLKFAIKSSQDNHFRLQTNHSGNTASIQKDKAPNGRRDSILQSSLLPGDDGLNIMLT